MPAEDNAVNQKVARRLLEKRGHSVTFVSNGLEAVEAFRRRLSTASWPFDCILMDVQMPEMDGLQATSAFGRWSGKHAERITPKFALLLLLFTRGGSDRDRCPEAGMNDFISKLIQMAGRIWPGSPSGRFAGAKP